MIIFISDKFKPYLPDDSQVNPNCYGFELAHWLSVKLAEKNFISSYPNYEDWGWFIERNDEDREIYICCTGNFKENNYIWQILVREPKKIFSKAKFKEHEIESIYLVIGSILTENNITFNNNK